MTAYWAKRLRDVARAAAMRTTLRARERWSRDRLDAFQRERLSEIVTHAKRHSPFYRELYAHLPSDRAVSLGDLPVITKDTMMEQFDDFVTDARLRRTELEAHLAEVAGDVLYRDEYRVMSSSGSTGRKGVYVFNRREWTAVMGGAMRWMDMIGVRPTFPRRKRLCAIGAPDAKHMTYRGAASINVGLFNTLQLSATHTLPHLVAELNRFQPDALNAYPSAAAMLAEEQIEGRLRIAPQIVCTSSELRTEDMTDRIRNAWAVEPFDCMGLTETGIAAVDCAAHEGLHVFEDQCILEVVDQENLPVAPGCIGDKLLVTSLFRRTQPIIRMEVSDLLRLTDAPCPCGRSLKRISVIGGRSDDVLQLPGARGGTVTVHPIHLRSPLTKLSAIVQYQIAQESDGLHVRIVLAGGAVAEKVVADAEAALRSNVVALGAVLPIRLEVVAQIPRETGAGKFKVIKSAATKSAKKPVHPALLKL